MRSYEMERFHYDLHELDSKREQLRIMLMERGSATVCEDLPRYGFAVAEENMAPVCTLNRVEIRDMYDIDLWYIREAQKIVSYHRRHLSSRDEYEWRYRYHPYMRHHDDMSLREQEYAFRRTEQTLRLLREQEAMLRQLEHRMLKALPPPNQPFTPLPPPHMSECNSLTVVQKARQLFLAKDEKLLRKAGLKDQNGNWTNDSIRVFVEMLLEDQGNKKKLLELAKELTRKKKDDEEDAE